MVLDPKERVTSSDESDNNFPISLIDFLGIIPDISPETLFVVEFVDEQIYNSSLGMFVASKLISQSSQIEIENIALDETFMFENVGRSRLVELGGIDNQRILSAISG